MTTKFDLGEKVVFYDFEDEIYRAGNIEEIKAWIKRNHESEDASLTIASVCISYIVNCEGVFFEESEKHLFKSVKDCAEYHSRHINIEVE
jgi:hypothetical protein